MERAREILGVQQEWLGFMDSGLPEGDPKPPLPEGCFALVPVEEAAEPLVRILREFRPQVVITYDENGGYPHPDHIQNHLISIAAIDAAADETQYPEFGPPWQVAKVYYVITSTRTRARDPERLLGPVSNRPTRSGWSGRTSRSTRAGSPPRWNAASGSRSESSATRPRHPGGSQRQLVPGTDVDSAGGLAHRGLSAGTCTCGGRSVSGK